jgi:hypothetical protein
MRSMRDNYTRIERGRDLPIHRYRLDWNNTKGSEIPFILQQVRGVEDSTME